MPGFKVINVASEKEGARKLLEAMLQVPPVPEALRMLEQGADIARIGSWLQRDILTAFEQERERSQQLQSDLAFQKREVATFQRIIETINADPLEQKSRRAEAARAAAEKQLQDAQREVASLRQQREMEMKLYGSQIRDLKQRVAELNHLTAIQHQRLEDLTGSGSPE